MEGDSSQSAWGSSYSSFEIGSVDEGALWLGGNDNLDGGWGFIGSLESGGALLSSGSWSISTEPGEEGLRWNGVKTELLCGAGNGVLKPPALPPATGLPATSKGTATSTTLPGVVKPDPEDTWEANINDVTRSTSGDVILSAKPIAASSFPLQQPASKNRGPRPPARSAGTSASEHPKARGAVAAGVASAKAAPAKVAPARAVPGAGKKTRPAGVAPVAAPVTNAEPVEEPEEEETQDLVEDDDEKSTYREDDELDPGSELNDKRRRNREHAKRSRMRKRVRLGGLEGMVLSLRRENVRLRQIIKQSIPDRADDIIRTCARDNTNADLVAKQDVVQGMRPAMSISSSSRWSSRSSGDSGGSRSRPKLEGGARHRSGSGRGKDRRVPSALKLMSPSYQTVKALCESQANFILTNPNLPDCPIIFASQGFLDLTGYKASQVIGKNCRFLQGPGTDPLTVSIVRNNLASGRDTSVCILNYKADGTPFWNQLSIGVLLDAQGQVANHVGVLCKVNQMPPAVFHKLLHRVPLPESLLNDDSSESGDDVVDTEPPKYDSRAGRSGSSGGAEPAPRVVDRLRRTRAAAATASTAT